MKIEVRKWEGVETYEVRINGVETMYISEGKPEGKPNLVISRGSFDNIRIVVAEIVETVEEAKKAIENVGKGIELKYEIVIGGLKTIT